MWFSVVCTLVDNDMRHHSAAVVKMLCNKLSYITKRALCFKALLQEALWHYGTRCQGVNFNVCLSN